MPNGFSYFPITHLKIEKKKKEKKKKKKKKK